MLPFSKEWGTDPPGLHTDHQLISARISARQMPFLGRGRWVIPLFILKNEDLTNEIITQGREMHRTIVQSHLNRTDINNPQIALKNFKDKVTTICRNAARKTIPKIQQRMKTLKSQLHSTLNDLHLSHNEQQLVGLELQQQISNLEMLRHSRARDNLAAKMKIECESPVSKFWSQSSKTRTPRDTIIELHKPNPSDTTNAPTYETKSAKMATLAGTYHNSLQYQDIAPDEERKLALE